MVIILKLIRALVDYFECQRVRIKVRAEILIAFVIREFMTFLFVGNVKAIEIAFWALGIVPLVGARILAPMFKPAR